MGQLKVSWTKYGLAFCGGAIYSSNVIITAAHCCEDIDSSYEEYEIIAGELNPTNNDSGQRRNIISHVSHLHYNPHTKENDICLLLVDHNFDFSDENVAKIALNKDSLANPGDSCIIAGWNKTSVIISFASYFIF